MGGTTAEYTRNHRRVTRERGRADSHMCEWENCDKPAAEWAQTHDTDPAIPANYRPLCRSHHKRYDGVYERVSEANRRRKGQPISRANWEARDKRYEQSARRRKFLHQEEA